MFCLWLVIHLWRNNRQLTVFSSFSFVFIRHILSSEIWWWMNVIALRPASSIFSLIIMLSFGPLENLLFPASIVHSLPLVSDFYSRGFLVSISVHSALLAIVHSAYYMTSHEDSTSHSLFQWLCISDDWVLWWLPQVSSKGHKLVLATLNSFLNSSSCYRVRISSYIIRHSVLFLKFNAQTKVLRWTMRFHCKYNLGHRVTH